MVSGSQGFKGQQGHCVKSRGGRGWGGGGEYICQSVSHAPTRVPSPLLANGLGVNSSVLLLLGSRLVHGQKLDLDTDWTMVDADWTMVDADWAMVDADWTMVDADWVMVKTD